MSGGSPYIVGERGPEMFVPRQSGSIIPNHAMGGMTVNVMMPADALRNPSIAAQRGAEFGAAAAQEMRRRGALA